MRKPIITSIETVTPSLAARYFAERAVNRFASNEVMPRLDPDQLPRSDTDE
jgi:hypothetical protein